MKPNSNGRESSISICSAPQRTAKRGTIPASMDLKERAADILGRKADIMTRASLHPLLKERIEAAAVLVF